MPTEKQEKSARKKEKSAKNNNSNVKIPQGKQEKPAGKKEKSAKDNNSNVQLKAVEDFFEFTIALLSPENGSTGLRPDVIRSKMLEKREHLRGILDKDLWAVFEKRNAYFEYALSMLPDKSADEYLEESENSSSDDDDDDDDDEDGYDDDDVMKGEEEGDDNDMEVDDEEEEEEEEGDDDEEEKEEDGGEDIEEKTEEPVRPCNTEGQQSKTKGSKQAILITHDYCEMTEITTSKMVTGKRKREDREENAESDPTKKKIKLKEKIRERIQELEAKRTKPSSTDDPKELKRQKRRLSKHKMRQKRKEVKEVKKDETVVKEETKEEKRKFNEEGNILYSKIEFPTVGKKKKSKLRKLLPTGKNYQALIEKVEKQKEKLNKLEKSDAAATVELKEKIKWQTALAKAEGLKVKDDVDLLKKSLAKKNHKKERSKSGWEEREKKLKKRLDDQQKKRKENIQKRQREKKEKKMKHQKKVRSRK